MPRRKKVENLSLEEMLMKTEQEIKTTEAELKDLRLNSITIMQYEMLLLLWRGR